MLSPARFTRKQNVWGFILVHRNSTKDFQIKKQAFLPHTTPAGLTDDDNDYVDQLCIP